MHGHPLGRPAAASSWHDLGLSTRRPTGPHRLTALSKHAHQSSPLPRSLVTQKHRQVTARLETALSRGCVAYAIATHSQTCSLGERCRVCRRSPVCTSHWASCTYLVVFITLLLEWGRCVPGCPPLLCWHAMVLSDGASPGERAEVPSVAHLSIVLLQCRTTDRQPPIDNHSTTTQAADNRLWAVMLVACGFAQHLLAISSWLGSGHPGTADATSISCQADDADYRVARLATVSAKHRPHHYKALKGKHVVHMASNKLVSAACLTVLWLSIGNASALHQDHAEVRVR